MLIDKFICDNLIKYLDFKEEYLNGHNKNIVFLFCIGSYPHTPNLDHENPVIYKNLIKDKRFKVVKILIDYFYIDNDRPNLDTDTYIVPKKIDLRDYDTIINFCNFAGAKNKSLSIVLEFTSILRKIDYIYKPYVYISPSDCLADTSCIEYKPVIENEFGYDVEFDNSLTIDKFRFFDFDRNKPLHNELKNLLENSHRNINKIHLVRNEIITNLLKINLVHRKMMCFMRLREEFELNFNKDHEAFDKSIQKLLYRMSGYYSQNAQKLISDFKESNFRNLFEFLEHKIQNILIDTTYLELNCMVENDIIKNIQFIVEDDNELKNKIIYFENVFADIIDSNNLKLF